MVSTPNRKCACGETLTQFQRGLCFKCEVQRTIDSGQKVEPSFPCCIVDTDTFFEDMEDAQEEFAGSWAHPCETVPLFVNAKRLAADLVEQVVEGMCEEAFEDAYDYVNGEADLTEAFEKALIAFNDKQTAYSWNPITKQVFQIPDITE